MSICTFYYLSRRKKITPAMLKNKRVFSVAEKKVNKVKSVSKNKSKSKTKESR